jgi:hypothetical protein
MTIQEYINKNLPFYHITKTALLPKIMKEGLKSGINGICVTRNIDPDVLYEIISRQIDDGGDDTFSIIELSPAKHEFTADDVCEDSVEEITAPLHNYILKKSITIDEDDVIKRDYKPDIQYAEIDESKIKALEGYTQHARPNLSDVKELL